jgi:hypothetical protein
MNTEAKTKTSKISLWKSHKADSKATHYGSLEITPEVIQFLSNAEPNEYGMVKLDVLLFKNDRGGEKVPGWVGYVNPPKDGAPVTDDEF